MSWKDNLIPASFRGVPFKINSSTSGFGRRSVQHEYPMRDIPYSEDLGRKKQEFAVEAFVVGDDYQTQRDNLIRACEQTPGSGRLDHPYYGSKFVVCVDCRVSETTEEGRMARISLVFAEAGTKNFPSFSTNFLSRLGSAGNGLISSALSNFTNSFNVSDFQSFVLGEASTLVGQMTDVLQVVKGVASGASVFTQGIQTFLNDFETLAQTPAILGQEIISIISSIGDLDLGFDGTVNAYKSFFHFGEEEEASIFTPSDGEISTSREQIMINRQAITDLVIMTAVAKGAVAAVEKAQKSPKPGQIITKNYTPLDPMKVEVTKTYPTHESIIAERDEILVAIDTLIDRTTDDEVYQGLQGQRRAVIQALPSPDLDFPSLVTIENNQTRPVLVLAYDLYEKLEMEVDIIKRNKIAHPGFVPGGLSLEVIRNG